MDPVQNISAKIPDQTDTQTDKQMNRWTNKWTDGQMDIEMKINRPTSKASCIITSIEVTPCMHAHTYARMYVKGPKDLWMAIFKS